MLLQLCPNMLHMSSEPRWFWRRPPTVGIHARRGISATAGFFACAVIFASSALLTLFPGCDITRTRRWRVAGEYGGKVALCILFGF